MTDTTARVVVHPLERRDPPMLGAVLIHGRLAASDAGVVYAGQLIDQLVVVVALTDGAETDSFGRARFDLAVQAVIDDRTGDVVAADRDADVAPWVALASTDDWGEALGVAGRVLAPVTLTDVAPIGAVRGPDFRPHWYQRRGIGRWRLWPLPWPRDLNAAGRWTFVAAFGLMLVIAALALWIATLVFHSQPVPPPPPPRRTRIVPSPPPITLPNPTSPIPSQGTGPTGPPSPGSPEPTIM
jgi:hypothetical protein